METERLILRPWREEGSLDRGETPLSPSYIDRAVDVAVFFADMCTENLKDII